MDAREPDYAALAQFRHLVRRFLAFSAARAREAGLEPRQHQLLLSIKGLSADRPPTIGALAEHLLLRHHSTVELVDRMETNGLVKRRRGRDDRRTVLVSITARGQRLLRRLSLVHQEELRTAGPALVAALGATLATAGGVPPEPAGDGGGR